MNSTINHMFLLKIKKYNYLYNSNLIQKKEKHQLFTSGRIGSIDKIGLLWRV
jgi:hypothetical protein